MDPARFFEEVLPALARERAADFPALASTAIVAVGARAWTCRLHDSVTPVVKGVDRALLRTPPSARDVRTKRTKKRRLEDGRPAFTLWVDESVFASLLDGTLDDARAVRERRIGYTGDVRWLEQLGRLLSGTTRLGARVS